VVAKVLPQYLAEVLLGGSIGRAIVVRQVEMRHASIEGSPDDCPARLEDVDTAEVLPKSKRNPGQYNSRLPAPLE
jgi:hypothetical protein